MISQYFEPSFIDKAKVKWLSDPDHYDTEGFLEFVVDSWPEMLGAALSYLRGDILSTPYHSIPLHNESLPILTKLIQMTEMGYLTTSSEPGASHLVRHQPLNPNLSYFDLADPTTYKVVYVDQRPYISGLMDKTQAFDLWRRFNELDQNRFVMFLFWEEQTAESYTTLKENLESSTGQFNYTKDLLLSPRKPFLQFRVPQQPFPFAFRKMLDVLQHFRLQLASVDFLDLQWGESYDLFDFVINLLQIQEADPEFIRYR